MSKVLVSFFSASGVTKKLASNLAEAISADLFEIVPEAIYTDEDLNWQNANSRSSVEMKDRSCRPAITSKVNDMASYDIILIGFPIWWYREPSIIDTFAEAYDFAGKTIVPFATSGSSGMGDSAKIIAELAKGAQVLEGKRFSANASKEELKGWFEGLGV
ncbi:MAG: NAD(P)H-dependent oxidoreductase [Lachnospiraceae bacterium]|nr:NAD(P)H-dependent oxidoreductase [Lachnospiraceae bacterium]